VKPFLRNQPLLHWETSSRVTLWLWISVTLVSSPLAGQVPEDDDQGIYSKVENSSIDGIGKAYLGREISHVMGHRGANWLERDSREEEENPDLLIEELKIQPGWNIADIGAGTGYYCRRLAEATGKSGTVFAVDIQPEMLAYLRENMRTAGHENVVPILGDIDDPKLHGIEIDLALMVDVYHEFSNPYEMLVRMTHALAPDGQIVFAEYRAEDPEVPIKPLHKMTEAQVIREAEFVGLKHVKTVRSLPWQHLIFFEKAPLGDPAEPTDSSNAPD